MGVLHTLGARRRPPGHGVTPLIGGLAKGRRVQEQAPEHTDARDSSSGVPSCRQVLGTGATVLEARSGPPSSAILGEPTG